MGFSLYNLFISNKVSERKLVTKWCLSMSQTTEKEKHKLALDMHI